nr:PREDICTED: USP6 N-terminal-like protein [Paralichthys olivaceus]
MSQIAALLLMFMNEEDAFWALSQLLTNHKHGMHGFFVPGFPKLQRFQTHHDQIISKLIPKLKKHLDREQMSAGIYCTKWFLQCFIDRTPFTLTLRLWDIFILEGEKLLTAMSYNVLKIHRKRLVKMSLEELREFLQERIAQTFFYSDDVIVEQLQASMSELRKMKLDLPPPGKPDELPRKPLGQELPLLLSPVRVKTSSASSFPRAGLSLHIISHQPDTISPDQSPSKDPRDLDAAEEAPLPSPDPIIIHSQVPLTPDGSPLMGPPPYQPPGSRTLVTTDQLSLPDRDGDEMQPDAAAATARQIADTLSSDSSAAVSADHSSHGVPRTLSAPAVQVASPGSVLAHSGSLSAVEAAEDGFLVELPKRNSSSLTEENQTPDVS